MSAIAADHVNNPRNSGPLEGFTHFGQVGAPGEGAFVQIWLRVEDNQERGTGSDERAAFASRTESGGKLLTTDNTRQSSNPSLGGRGCERSEQGKGDREPRNSIRSVGHSKDEVASSASADERGHQPPSSVRVVREPANGVGGENANPEGRISGTPTPPTPQTIKQANYATHGCLWSIACASVLAQLATGRTTAKARLIEPHDIDVILGGLPEGKGEYAEMSVQALRKALGDE